LIAKILFPKQEQDLLPWGDGAAYTYRGVARTAAVAGPAGFASKFPEDCPQTEKKTL